MRTHTANYVNTACKSCKKHQANNERLCSVYDCVDLSIKDCSSCAIGQEMMNLSMDCDYGCGIVDYCFYKINDDYNLDF